MIGVNSTATAAAVTSGTAIQQQLPCCWLTLTQPTYPPNCYPTYTQAGPWVKHNGTTCSHALQLPQTQKPIKSPLHPHHVTSVPALSIAAVGATIRH